jgi:hypothetical protein
MIELDAFMGSVDLGRGRPEGGDNLTPLEVQAVPL